MNESINQSINQSIRSHIGLMCSILLKSEHELIKFTPIANQISIVRACSDYNQIKESLPVPYILI